MQTLDLEKELFKVVSEIGSDDVTNEWLTDRWFHRRGHVTDFITTLDERSVVVKYRLG